MSKWVKDPVLQSLVESQLLRIDEAAQIERDHAAGPTRRRAIDQLAPRIAGRAIDLAMVTHAERLCEVEG